MPIDHECSGRPGRYHTAALPQGSWQQLYLPLCPHSTQLTVCTSLATRGSQISLHPTPHPRVTSLVLILTTWPRPLHVLFYAVTQARALPTFTCALCRTHNWTFSPWIWRQCVPTQHISVFSKGQDTFRTHTHSAVHIYMAIACRHSLAHIPFYSPNCGEEGVDIAQNKIMWFIPSEHNNTYNHQHPSTTTCFGLF